MRRLPVGILGLVVLAAGPGRLAADPVEYVRDIKPVFADKCYACHGALQQKSGLRVDTVRFLREGGNKGPAVVPGHSERSPLVYHVTATHGAKRMPPASDGEPLTARQIELVKAWIDQGARGPADEKPEADPRDHWAFRPPVRPPVPKVRRAGWAGNPVDAFLAAEWEKRGLTPQPPADRRLLLRRAYLDLVGLPPGRAELEAFAADPSPDAYERAVDRLLESPQYGERWARHWMDVWRYSDWWGLGQEVRNSQKHIWHWRDWMIESLNADKGYDQMVREMLAADELYPNDLQRLRATGYLVRPYFIFNRTTWLDEVVEHTAKGFLGLTLNCAKCHDHKYDPVRQADYYRFRAFFEPYQLRTEQVPGEADFTKDGIPRAYDCNADAPTYLFRRGDDRQPVKDRPLAPGLPRLFVAKLGITPVVLPAEAHAPQLRPFVLENYLRAAEGQIRTARAGLEQAQTTLAAVEKKKAQVASSPQHAGGEGMLIFRDDFARLNGELWQTGPGRWQVDAGKVRQVFPGEMRSFLRAKKQPPADFQARLKFTLTGGEPWRSVGITFDAAGENEALVYATAHQGGPRLQVAYKQGGAYVYPPEGSRPWPVKLHEPLELAVRVRGPLVNVAVNGRPALAYRLPIARRPGNLELITYAATAEFQVFELATLPEGVKLEEPKAGGAAARPATVEQARAAVLLAEKALTAAELQPPLLRAKVAADRARYRQPPAPDFKDLARKAAALERQAAVAKAEEDLARAELDLLQVDSPKKAEAEKKRAAARQALDQARKALASPGEAYTALRGAVKAPESNLETEASRGRPFPATSTGRRSALARWITDRGNPLAARVAVNHVWMRHFGRPLVPTIFDFGRKGTPPTHPELLDWLAVDFMEHGWSLKHLHRVIVTSRAYRLSSSTARAPARNREVDPENRYYWHREPVRMEAQAVRDSLLALAGALDRKMGGPSVPAADEASRRRSLYYVHSHNDSQMFLALFDDAPVRECYRRSESIVPQQALALANSKVALEMAARINDRLHEQLGKVSDREFARAAFELVLAASPTAEELAACEAALREWASLLTGRPDASRRARANLVHALVNHNDFITVR
jgi:hypothetical protein